MTIKCPECQTENTLDSQFCKKCATPLPLSEGISVTKTLETPVKKLARETTFANRYEILEELGKGGMGEVYKVRDKKLDEVMALKVLKPEIAADKGIIERFKNELKLARKITHRNVCRIYDLNEDEEIPYITMEYVEGDNLKTHIRKVDKLAQEEAISLAKQVCEGLTEAHELGVVHRDLKPQNIMIDEKITYRLNRQKEQNWRARIAAILGEKELAMRLLQEALEQGVNCQYRWLGRPYIHPNMDLEPLCDYPPFQELIKPKG